MHTTLVLGGVSPHSVCDSDADDGNHDHVVALPPRVFPLPEDVIPASLPGPCLL